ncbi:MAG: MarR family transcriptional regulator [Bacteroidota bacterium]
MITINEIFRNQHEYIKSRHKISALEMDLIQFVVRNGPQKMKAIAENFAIKLSTLTSIIDKAERHRILKRVNSKEDRRVVYLDVTKKGERINQEFNEYLHEVAEKIQGSLDEEFFSRFVEGMETFNQISSK